MKSRQKEQKYKCSDGATRASHVAAALQMLLYHMALTQLLFVVESGVFC